MSGRSWFVASGDKQEGPYSEDQLRDLIARGNIRTDTYVWAEGMEAWQFAGDVPGLLTTGRAPPAMPRPGTGAVTASSGHHVQIEGAASNALHLDTPLWEFFWRGLVLCIGSLFIIPVPWLLVWFLKWLVPCVQVPGRPNLSFEGNAMAMVPWYFGTVVLSIALSLTGSELLSNLGLIAQVLLSWFLAKWLIANLASEGQPLGLSFSGTAWAYLGWNVLLFISIITIIGWAWVYVAWKKWFCRNIQGTRREVTFNGTALEILWRGIVLFMGIALIVPIPWVLRWYWQWYVSQFSLESRA